MAGQSFCASFWQKFAEKPAGDWLPRLSRVPPWSAAPRTEIVTHEWSMFINILPLISKYLIIAYIPSTTLPISRSRPRKQFLSHQFPSRTSNSSSRAINPSICAVPRTERALRPRTQLRTRIQHHRHTAKFRTTSAKLDLTSASTSKSCQVPSKSQTLTIHRIIESMSGF